jgi:NitT/TauT family transport system substrate-binding protein
MSRSPISPAAPSSLQSLVGGSVDIVTGAYEHTIRMQAQGAGHPRAGRAGALPGHRHRRAKDLADKVKSAADLKGLKIGVTAPGSSTNLMVSSPWSRPG